ncbi:MAG: ATP-binding protein [Candidatus Krumholzibacteriia bacterium]
MIKRENALAAVAGLSGRHPVTAILGARQVGKTTLARALAAQSAARVTVFDLENPDHLARLQDPLLALQELRGLVILDEIQRRPEIFPVLRVLADRPRRPATFVVLGSASPALLRQSSESLAGRITYFQLGGLSLQEVGLEDLTRLWLRGGFPRSFLAKNNAHSMEWRRDFIATFLERDVPQLGIPIPAPALRRFWTMLAHWHGQLWNASEFARSFGVSDQSVRRYLDALTATYVVRQLPPYHANISKRQVKMPRVYVADSGLLHALLGIGTVQDLVENPKVGASWEGFAMREVTQRLGARPEECFFWRTHQGAELDLLVVRGRRRLGFEFKRTTAPAVTPSMRIALDDLGLESISVIHAGRTAFPMGEKIRAVPLQAILTDLDPL